MKHLEISYDPVENLISVKNNSDIFTNKMWFSVCDCETNLNVEAWWMIIAPYETQVWNLPVYFYDVAREFDINVMDENFNFLLKKNVRLKKLNSKINFKHKSPMDRGYGPWYNLVNSKEYDVKFRSDDIVYDLGGNVGAFSKWSLMQNVGYVYLFEPDKECISRMSELFEKDKDKIQLINKAIADEHKKMNFYLHENSVSNTLYANSDYYVEVDCVNLEKFIAENGLKKPTVIKCDIEGLEYAFIKSLSDSFFDSVRIFILEFHFIYDPNARFHFFETIERFLTMRYSVRLTNVSNFKNDMGNVIFEKLI